MINVSPIGRNASNAERHEFEAYDKIHGVRAKFVEALKAKFGHLGLTYSIGGMISFDVVRWPNRSLRLETGALTNERRLFRCARTSSRQAGTRRFRSGTSSPRASPTSTFSATRRTRCGSALRSLDMSLLLTLVNLSSLYLARALQGGNDHEIFEDERTIGHAVTCPEDTMKILNELFLAGK